MKLTQEQETVCAVFRRRDRNGYVHCSDCPMRLDLQYSVCLKVVSKEDALSNWDWNGSQYPAIDKAEGEQNERRFNQQTGCN